MNRRPSRSTRIQAIGAARTSAVDGVPGPAGFQSGSRFIRMPISGWSGWRNP